VTAGSSLHGPICLHNSRQPAPPGELELPSIWKRLRRLLLRWQAPQPRPAYRTAGLTRADSGRSRYGNPYALPYACTYADPYVRHPRTPSRLEGGVTAGRAPRGEWSGQAEWMRFARLIHRPVRVLGGPAVLAAGGGNLILPWPPHRVVYQLSFAGLLQGEARAGPALNRSPGASV